MNKISLKNKKVLLLLLTLSVLLFSYSYIYRTLDETTQIFEIKNTKEVYDYPDSIMITVRKNYMIINPPEDLQELKCLVEQFYKDNSLNEDSSVDNNNKPKYLEICFYRESKNFPRDWQPNETFMNVNTIIVT
ncbi:hypothetical protein [Alkaliphilus crotonatoxidans]